MRSNQYIYLVFQTLLSLRADRSSAHFAAEMPLWSLNLDREREGTVASTIAILRILYNKRAIISPYMQSLRKQRTDKKPPSTAFHRLSVHPIFLAHLSQLSLKNQSRKTIIPPTTAKNKLPRDRPRSKPAESLTSRQARNPGESLPDHHQAQWRNSETQALKPAPEKTTPSQTLILA